MSKLNPDRLAYLYDVLKMDSATQMKTFAACFEPGSLLRFIDNPDPQSPGSLLHHMALWNATDTFGYTIKVLIPDNLRATYLEKTDSEGQTALHWAAERNHSKFIEAYLNYTDVESDILNRTDRAGETPLMAAVGAKQKDAVAALLLHTSTCHFEEVDSLEVLMHAAIKCDNWSTFIDWSNGLYVWEILNRYIKKIPTNKMDELLNTAYQNYHKQILPYIIHHLDSKNRLPEDKAKIFASLGTSCCNVLHHLLSRDLHEEVSSIINYLPPKKTLFFILEVDAISKQCPISIAIKRNHVKVLCELIDFQSPGGFASFQTKIYACRDDNGRNLIHMAAAIGRSEILDILLGRITNEKAMELIRQTDITGRTALNTTLSHKFISKFTPLEVFSLITHKPTPKQYSLFYDLVSLNEYRLVSELLSKIGRQDPNMRKEIIQLKELKSETSLHGSALLGSAKMLKLLLSNLPLDDQYLALKAVNAEQQTPLHIAIGYQSTECVNEILQSRKPREIIRLEQRNVKSALQLAAEKISPGKSCEILKTILHYLDRTEECKYLQQIVEFLLKTEAITPKMLSDEMLYGDRAWGVLINAGLEYALIFVNTTSTSKRQGYLEKPLNHHQNILHRASKQGDLELLTELLNHMKDELKLHKFLLQKDNGKKTPKDLSKNCYVRNLLTWAEEQRGYYKLTHRPEVLLICNKSHRPNAQTEHNAAKDVFIGEVNPIISEEFDVCEHSLTTILKRKLEKVKKGSAVIVTIMSHGSRGNINDNFGKPIPIQDIIDTISENSDPEIPKVLILQCCQNDPGISPQLALPNDTRPGAENVPPSSPQPQMFSITGRNMSVLVATVSGGFARRNIFIPILANQIRSSQDTDDINEIFLKTSAEMQRICPEQVPVITHTLTKKLCIKRFYKTEARL